MEAIWRLKNDREAAAVTFSTDPPVTMTLTLNGVKSMIEKLGELRAAMIPEEPTIFIPGPTITAISNPSWTTEPELFQGDSLLHLRDPRFGWLHYCIPRDEARQLGRHLLAQADNPPPDMATGKPN